MAQSNQIGIDKFVWNDESASEDLQIYLFRFECFAAANELDINEPSDSIEAAQLLMTYGGKHLLDTLITETADFDALKLMNYKTMREILEKKYVNLNYRYNLVRLHNRKYKEGEETFVEYLAALKQLAKSAKNAAPTTETLVLDKLILCNSTPDKLRNKMLEDTTITLSGLVDFQKKKEIRAAVKATFESPTLLNMIEYRNNRNKNYAKQTRSASVSDQNSAKTYVNTSKPKANECFNCGFSPFTPEHIPNCRFKDVECDHCGIKGHGIKYCKKKKREDKTGSTKSLNSNNRKAYQMQMSNNNVLTLSPVYNVNSIKPKQPHISVNINGENFQMLADTGSMVNIIIFNWYNKMHNKPKLTHSTTELSGYNADKLIYPLGEFLAKITYGHNSTMAKFLVINNNAHTADNLLSLSTMQQLNMDFNTIFRINTVSEQIKTETQLYEDYLWANGGTKMNEAVRNHPKTKQLFNSKTGLLPDVVIKLMIDPSIEPKKVPMQKIALHLQQPCLEKCLEWRNNNIVRNVPPGTHLWWLSSINPVEKAHGKPPGEILTKDDVRITVNYKNLNKALLL
jgi:hypothetical protein